MPTPLTPLVATDAVVVDSRRRVLLIRRKFPPFQGMYALPGGFVEVGETLEDACRRELEEETGIKAGRLQLVGVYSDPKRDPRFHCISAVYLTRVRSSNAVAGDDAAAAEWIENWRRVDLAFDHASVLREAMRLLRRQDRR